MLLSAYAKRLFEPGLGRYGVLSNFTVRLCAVLTEVANALTVSMVGTAAPTHQAVDMANSARWPSNPSIATCPALQKG